LLYPENNTLFGLFEEEGEQGKYFKLAYNFLLILPHLEKSYNKFMLIIITL
jgi:hypothetical protein